jgi:hypothetical protein
VDDGPENSYVVFDEQCKTQSLPRWFRVLGLLNELHSLCHEKSTPLQKPLWPNVSSLEFTSRMKNSLKIQRSRRKPARHVGACRRGT